MSNRDEYAYSCRHFYCVYSEGEPIPACGLNSELDPNCKKCKEEREKIEMNIEMPDERTVVTQVAPESIHGGCQFRMVTLGGEVKCAYDKFCNPCVGFMNCVRYKPSTQKVPVDNYDVISKPSHYAEGRKYEPKDVIRDWKLNFNLGSAVKYISRAGRKDDVLQDLKKARQFLDFEIDAIELEREDNCSAIDK